MYYSLYSNVFVTPSITIKIYRYMYLCTSLHLAKNFIGLSVVYKLYNKCVFKAEITMLLLLY